MLKERLELHHKELKELKVQREDKVLKELKDLKVHKVEEVQQELKVEQVLHLKVLLVT